MVSTALDRDRALQVDRFIQDHQLAQAEGKIILNPNTGAQRIGTLPYYIREKCFIGDKTNPNTYEALGFLVFMVGETYEFTLSPEWEEKILTSKDIFIPLNGNGLYASRHHIARLLSANTEAIKQFRETHKPTFLDEFL